CTVRDTRGQEIDAACGQLAAAHKEPGALGPAARRPGGALAALGRRVATTAVSPHLPGVR
ncbi:hypothetical protein, partial [Pseudonocardia sp.]|uniref:hypothetical protein n=1 Tax=Pseudonocardia sp. TaxID=60912 RepID=UPI003D09EF66